MRRLVTASAIALVVAATLLTGSGVGSSADAARRTQAIPAALAAAIHARLGGGPIRLAARSTVDAADPELGIRVALSADGTTAIAGAPGVAENEGAAYIFHTSDAGSWSSSNVPTAVLSHKPSRVQEKELLGMQLFGLAVALSPDGTTAFVGAPFVIAGKNTIGAVYVFHASSEDAWSSSSKPAATLTATDGELVGATLAVSTDGATLVTGAPWSNNLLGAAYVFHASSQSAWATTSTPAAALSNATENSSTDSAVGGAGVAISGDGTTALVSDSENTSNGGGAFVYHVAAADAWTSSSTPTAILSNAGGTTLALSQDGTVAFLGSPGASSLEVFRVAGEGAWASTSTPTATLTAAGGSLGDEYGVPPAVSADGTTVLVGAEYAPARSGAYVFRVANEADWATTSLATAALTNSKSRFTDGLGTVALSADGATALVGDPGFLENTGAGDLFHVADASSWASSSSPNAVLTDKKLAACVVPKLKGLKLSAAELALAAGRCNLGKVAKVHAKTKKARGKVLSQSKKPGKRLAIGAKISIKVGK